MGIYDREYYRDEQDAQGPALRLPQTMVVRLILINAAVFLLNLLFGDRDNRVMSWLSLDQATIKHPWEWWRLLSYAFAHDPARIFHIVGNMLGLWFFGPPVEALLGRGRFLRYYLMAALVGGLTWALHSLAAPGASAVLGASGAITAVVILFVLNFPQERVHLFGVLGMPAWVFGIILVASDLLGLGGAGVRQHAYDVHLSGALFAVIYHRFGGRFGGWPPRGFTFAGARRGSSKGGPPQDVRIYVPEEESDPTYDDLDAQADRVLDKLHRHGDASLTPDERRVLEAYSRRMRQKHR